MRVFLDTNVLVSALTTRGLSADLVRLILSEHELLTGEINLVELRRVIRRKIGVPARKADQAENFLREHTIIPRPAKALDIELRDADDKWILGSAMAGGADVLVTGDKDLLDLGAAAPLTILSPRAFWESLRRNR